ncbi:MAG: DNA-directed RNA polymerase subunit alpha [Candidatus Pacebacteria bacterium]|nr:DNA-directed RNA polymerase subunit alpha [Candidatus Paceibacterota bacterium]
MINLPNPPKIVKKEGNKALFEIEALYPGYGVTIGNSLRRVLLSSLEGAAVTQMKIKGVSHEFSTIAGITEDVITIMLNLKQLRFKLFNTSEPQKATLKVRGEKEVKGSDFELSSQVELINKNCHIATLTTKSSELEMEIQIEKGIGYSPREGRTKEKLEIGAIPLDAIFTPVKRVSYRIENMRVGERTDYDRLFLEVETDGVISPEEAMLQSSEILVNHFSLLAETLKPKAVPVAREAQKKEKKPDKKKKVKHEKVKKRKKTK